MIPSAIRRSPSGVSSSDTLDFFFRLFDGQQMSFSLYHEGNWLSSEQIISTMSRLMIKNLPSYVTPVRLRQHFEQQGCPAGILTDVKVAYKSDGTSRRFGFVGYKTDEEAFAARNWFDKTFIDSTRIHVTLIDVWIAFPLIFVSDHNLHRVPKMLLLLDLISGQG